MTARVLLAKLWGARKDKYRCLMGHDISDTCGYAGSA